MYISWHNNHYATQCPLCCQPHLIFLAPLINLRIRIPGQAGQVLNVIERLTQTHPLLLENVPLWASQGFFISGELKRFYPGGIFTILKESNLNMTKYLNRNPAAGSWCRILQEKIKLFSINNIKKMSSMAN